MYTAYSMILEIDSYIDTSHNRKWEYTQECTLKRQRTRPHSALYSEKKEREKKKNANRYRPSNAQQ